MKRSICLLAGYTESQGSAKSHYKVKTFVCAVYELAIHSGGSYQSYFKKSVKCLCEPNVFQRAHQKDITKH